jgi:predicted RNA polymerase sigma factor
MELQASRLGARISPSGEPVLLLDQDRRRWDPLLIRRGLAALEQALELERAPGRYSLQAGIAACHARARTPAETDWERMAALYSALAEVAPSPVVALNRAVAVGMAFGPRAGLEVAEAAAADGRLDGYHHLAAVRGHLLEMQGRLGDARAQFEMAAALTGNQAEQQVLRGRAAACREAAAGTSG